jgi:hypothetical protein
MRYAAERRDLAESIAELRQPPPQRCSGAAMIVIGVVLLGEKRLFGFEHG